MSLNSVTIAHNLISQYISQRGKAAAAPQTTDDKGYRRKHLVQYFEIYMQISGTIRFTVQIFAWPPVRKPVGQQVKSSLLAEISEETFFLRFELDKCR